MTRLSTKDSKTTKFLGVWIPADLHRTVDQAVKATDDDHSKFIRKAIRSRLKELGFQADTNSKAS